MASSPASAAARQLLILDDDPMVGLLMQTVAELDGVPTTLTATPEEFFAALARSVPTHIVLDLTMPGLSGESVLQALAQGGCTARIIISSGAEPQRLQDAALQGGAQGLQMAGVLPKPFAAAALRALLAPPQA